MQTRKDLLQAHRLMTQRASQALILGEPDTPELPLRRLNVATFMGVMVAVLVLAAFGIVGLLSPGGAQGLEQPGTIIIEKETGARYVWCQGSKLCPVANYTSAKLLAGSGQTSQRLVSRNSLSKYDRGPMLGIPGAPDTLPDPNKLVKMPWSVCVRTAELALSGPTSLVTLVAGKSVGGQPMPDDQAIIVQADKQPWVIWKGQRLRVSPDVVPALTSTASVPEVAPKWLNAVAEGTDFKGPDITGMGQSVPGPQGQSKVGQIFTVANVTGSQAASYVLMSDGLAPISDIEAQLMKADPAVRTALGGVDNPISLQPDVFGRAPKHAANVSRLQGTMPRFAPYAGTTPLCTTYSDQSGKQGGKVVLGAQLPPPPDSAAGGATGVDQLVFPPGGAALAGVLPSPGKPVSTVYLVTEGRRFALQSTDVAQKLGYALATDAVPVPAGVIELIPSGPALDPATAANPVAQAGASAQPTG